MSTEKRPRVAHIVPSMTLGGVEVGVTRSYEELCLSFDYRVFHVLRTPGELECGQRHIFTFFKEVLSGKWRPDLVVTSLSWSHPLGHLCRLFGIPWLAFFHNSGFSHFRDELSQRWAWRWANYRVADSEATRAAMSIKNEHPCPLIPYYFPQTLTTLPQWECRNFDLIWVGRSHPTKRLDLLEELLRRVMQLVPQARVALVVAGDPPLTLKELAADSQSEVVIYQNIDNGKVRELMSQSRFYVLLSDYEGMSMSTVEAISAGCVPVVRPVGGIPVYVAPDSGFYVSDITSVGINEVATQLARCWHDVELAKKLTTKAQAAVNSLPTYVGSFVAALKSAT